MLTQKQLNLFNFLKTRLEKSNVSPSYEEMKVALGLNSKSGIHRLIIALEERGFIKRMHNKARAIEIINNKKDILNKNQLHFLEKSKRKVNIYGKIAAGTPIDMIKNNNQHYALKVSGTSMVDAGILDGDLAILEKTTDVNNGDIVVALIDGQEATLKRIRRKTNSIALEPANKKFETRIFGLGRVEIQGKLVGIIRNY